MSKWPVYHDLQFTLNKAFEAEVNDDGRNGKLVMWEHSQCKRAQSERTHQYPVGPSGHRMKHWARRK